MSAHAAIPCEFPGCAQTAAVVELIPRGAAYADGQKDFLHQLDSVVGTFRVSHFLPYANYSLEVPDYEGVVAAVNGVDGAGDGVAAVLYGLGKDFAPFFCAECGCSYCETHWQLRPSFDSGSNGFDYYSGACPVGHRKFIDH